VVEMVSANEGLVQFFRDQVKIENKIVQSLDTAVTDMRNEAVKGVLTGISLDSVKHAAMYRAAIRLLTTVTPALTDATLFEQRKLVEEHIRFEAELIERISERLPDVADERVKLLIGAVLADETKHHRLLTLILNQFIRRETMTEEDWWDLLWKEAQVST
jgi:hypothetical protein